MIAKWLERLGLTDWPVQIARSALTTKPVITLGEHSDHITLPVNANDITIVETLLRYAYHNVPTERRLTDHQIALAARELVNTPDQAWPPS